MIDQKTEIIMLYDFYGELLTPRQKTILEYYYQDDLSLGEIAETMEVSRQAVYDTIRKAKTALRTYEDRLGLLNRFLHQTEEIERAVREIDEVAGLLEGYPEAADKLNDVKQILYKISD